MVTRFRIYFIACTNVSSVICGTLHKPATFNDINNYHHHGSCASVITINYVHALKRRRRKHSNSYNDIQFLRCNCNSWSYCMDFLLNVICMKRLLGFLSSLFLFSPLLHPHYGINNKIMKNILIMTNVKKTLSL